MTNEKRLIDANALANEVEYSQHDNPHTNGRVRINHHNEHNHFLRMILDAPTVDAVEVVHSWWEKSVEGYKICHHCKADVAIFSGHKNYCPNCGAKMDGGNEDG